MIQTFKAEIHLAVSTFAGQNSENSIREFLEHLSGLGIHVDSIKLDPPDQEIPSSVNQNDLTKLIKQNTI